MIACCCGPLFWRFNYSTSIMNILLRKTPSNNSIFTNGESCVNIRMAGLLIFISLLHRFKNKVINMKKIIYIVSILFVAIVITTIAYALFDFNHENLIIIFFSSLISIIITEYIRKRIS